MQTTPTKRKRGRPRKTVAPVINEPVVEDLSAQVQQEKAMFSNVLETEAEPTKNVIKASDEAREQEADPLADTSASVKTISGADTTIDTNIDISTNNAILTDTPGDMATSTVVDATAEIRCLEPEIHADAAFFEQTETDSAMDTLDDNVQLDTSVGPHLSKYTIINASEDVRTPCTDMFFMTREAYERHSSDSFSNQVAKLSKSLPKSAFTAGGPSNPAEPTQNDSVETRVKRPRLPPNDFKKLSDIHVAAQAAEESSDSTTRYSKFKRHEHARYLQIANSTRPPSEEDKSFYDRMTLELKPEIDDFIKAQCQSVVASGVYNILNQNVENMIEAFVALERKRLSDYPRFYKNYQNFTIPNPPSNKESRPILTFKKRIARKGDVARVRIEEKFDSRTIDLDKIYIGSSDESSQDESFYQKKFPPPVSRDPTIEKCIQSENVHIVASSSFLLAIVELQNNSASEIELPVVVRINEETKVKTIYLDRPFPKETLTARERNKIVYDWAFKSMCLDWKHRHKVAPIASDDASTNSLDKGTSDVSLKTDSAQGDRDQQENLNYNLWSFGDLRILIRHQSDGYIQQDPRVSVDECPHVCLTTKLDYQIKNGLEETVTPVERAQNWILSYIAGHSMVVEGKINVSKNQLVRVVKKQMLDIMGDKWRPMQESELMHRLFTDLQNIPKPGTYILRHKQGDRCISILQGLEDSEGSDEAELDLQERCIRKPALGPPASSFVPAWRNSKEQVRWTFPLAD